LLFSSEKSRRQLDVPQRKPLSSPYPSQHLSISKGSKNKAVLSISKGSKNKAVLSISKRSKNSASQPPFHAACYCLPLISINASFQRRFQQQRKWPRPSQPPQRPLFTLRSRSSRIEDRQEWDEAHGQRTRAGGATALGGFEVQYTGVEAPEGRGSHFVGVGLPEGRGSPRKGDLPPQKAHFLGHEK
jgi:hypothetical protein